EWRGECPYCAAPQPASEQQEDSGGRSWEHTRSMLAMGMWGFSTRPDSGKNPESALRAIDAMTAAGTPLAWLRTAEQQEALTYSSTQATNCAVCGEHKHTPLRIDWMGGYVCLTCIDKQLESREQQALTDEQIIDEFERRAMSLRDKA